MLEKVEIATGLSSHPPADELTCSQVEALFSDKRSFAIGAFGVCVAALTVGWRTGSVAVYAVAALLLSVSVCRLLFMRAFEQRRLSAPGEPYSPRWEYYYHCGAALHISIISAFCLTTFLVTSNPLDRMLGMATILAYMAGIPGRNFANSFGVNIQIIFGAIPLLLSMVVAGKEYWLLICILFLPYFFALRGLANRLRGIFVEATTRAHELRALASRFDTALNNMSHGLAMFDSSGNAIVHNDRLIQLMRLDEPETYVGRSIWSLFPGLKVDAQSSESALDACLKVPARDPVEIEMSDGSSLELTFQAMPKGGAVALVQDITERKRAAARISQLALYDELTELANRAHFRTLLASRLKANSSGVKQALMFVDLDQFKQVNDTLGHSCGDALIREVADRVRFCAGENVVARFGGDEFVVLFGFDGPLEEAERMAQTIIETISRPYRIHGHNIIIGASIGISIFPDHDADPDQLLKKADLALYRAKAAGRGSHRIFEPAMSTQALFRREIEFDLRRALENDEFELFYQPIFDLEQGRYSVCEALLRWNHPSKGLVPPGDFIPVAEEMGLIVDIGNWVLQRACAECRTWPAHLRVAVNISPTQFRRGDIVTSVSSALQNAGLAPSRLELELTESVLLQDIAFTSLTMQLLHLQQVAISLDDFGTGYSSLSYLSELPLSKVKIDRSFLVGLGTRRKALLMLKGLTQLSTELGLSVVIEGVETEDQLKLIQQACDVREIQGYLLSRPVPAAQLRGVLHTVPRLLQKPGSVLRLAAS